MSWKKTYEKYKKTQGLCSKPYRPTKNQEEASDYCIKHGISISPWAAESGSMPRKWYVAVSELNIDFKKVYKSKFQYDNEQIWEEVYKAREYYYDKSKKQ